MSFRSRLAEWARGLVHDLLVNHVAATPLVPRPVRWRVLRAFGMPVQRSWIGTYVYLGSRRIHISEGVVIGAGSVVVKDCEPHTLYAGNPARAVRPLED